MLLHNIFILNTCRATTHLQSYYTLTQIQHTELLPNPTNCRAKSAQINLWHLETYLMLSLLPIVTVLLPYPWQKINYYRCYFSSVSIMKRYYLPTLQMSSIKQAWFRLVSIANDIDHCFYIQLHFAIYGAQESLIKF